MRRRGNWQRGTAVLGMGYSHGHHHSGRNLHQGSVRRRKHRDHHHRDTITGSYHREDSRDTACNNPEEQAQEQTPTMKQASSPTCSSVASVPSFCCCDSLQAQAASLCVSFC